MIGGDNNGNEGVLQPPSPYDEINISLFKRACMTMKSCARMSIILYLAADKKSVIRALYILHSQFPLLTSTKVFFYFLSAFLQALISTPFSKSPQNRNLNTLQGKMFLPSKIMLPFLPFLSIYISLFLHSFFNSSMSKLGVRFHYCANEMVLNIHQM